MMRMLVQVLEQKIDVRIQQSNDRTEPDYKK
jgi:hypothetical protein